MNAPQKGIEVELKEIGCPYSPTDERCSIWLDGYGKGQVAGIDAGAKVASEVYDKALTGRAA